MSSKSSSKAPCRKVHLNALKSEIRQAIINQKANACPIAVRLAWHASGTYNIDTNSGGSDGATMRFAPEMNDPANLGLDIIRNLLEPVKKKFPEISYSDLWVYAAICAIEFLGGPTIPFRLGRKDAPTASSCPVLGLLPDGAKGAQHLRDIFYRMGFNDQEIVALSGGHTLGSCHRLRSGFEGPWTRTPLKFDNGFFRNLLFMEWVEKKWDGPLQYEDSLTGELMMLPTDMALLWDESFRKWVEIYAKDEKAFFDDFAKAYDKLVSNGCFKEEQKRGEERRGEERRGERRQEDVELDHDFREACMHGVMSTVVAKIEKGAGLDSTEDESNRTGLHKAAFWGHKEIVALLVAKGANVNCLDYNWDTPLHDAVRLDHKEVVSVLLGSGRCDSAVVNREGKTPLHLAIDLNRTEIIALLQKVAKSKL